MKNELPTSYECDECGEEMDIEDDDGEEIRFDCPNGCGSIRFYVEDGYLYGDVE